jgi:hypothetical protein
VTTFDPDIEIQVDGLKALFEAGGRPWVAKDLPAVAIFQQKPPEVRRKIYEYATWAFESQWRTPEFTPKFHRFLASGDGERGAPVRKLAIVERRSEGRAYVQVRDGPDYPELAENQAAVLIPDLDAILANPKADEAEKRLARDLLEGLTNYATG